MPRIGNRKDGRRTARRRFVLQAALAALAAAVPAARPGARAGDEPPGAAEEAEAAPAAFAGSPLTWLVNDRVAVGLLPRIGGRVVYFGPAPKPGEAPAAGDNVLYANPAWWTDGDGDVPPVRPGAPNKPYNGHTTWLGPQTAWWTDQDWDPQRRADAATWPPNPHWETAPFRVVEHTRAFLALEGPRADPVGGWVLAKTVALRPDGAVELAVRAENASDRPRAWSIWSNTRVSGDAAAFFPLPTAARVEAAHRAWTAREGFLPFDMTGGWAGFVADTPVPAAERDRLEGKIFAAPARAGAFGAFVGRGARTAFWKTSRDVAGEDARAPGHAGVELYQIRRVAPDAASDHFAELEFHGPYTTLAPGGVAEFRETWRLLPYPGPPTRAARVAFLEAELARAAARGEVVLAE